MLVDTRPAGWRDEELYFTWILCVAFARTFLRRVNHFLADMYLSDTFPVCQVFSLYLLAIFDNTLDLRRPRCHWWLLHPILWALSCIFSGYNKARDLLLNFGLRLLRFVLPLKLLILPELDHWGSLPLVDFPRLHNFVCCWWRILR